MMFFRFSSLPGRGERREKKLRFLRGKFFDMKNNQFHDENDWFGDVSTKILRRKTKIEWFHFRGASVLDMHGEIPRSLPGFFIQGFLFRFDFR